MATKTYFFKNGRVNNELEAYLIGFIYADGCITTRYKDKYYRLSFSLSSKDTDFLIKIGNLFNRSVKYSKSKCNAKYYPITKLDISSVELIERLNSIGIFPRKTYESCLKLLSNIPFKYISHFIRGYFDGDGSIHSADIKEINKGKIAQYNVGFVSYNKDILLFIQKYFNSFFIGEESSVSQEKIKSSIYYRFRVGGNNNCRKIYDLLYKDLDKCNNLCLIRKKILFESIPKKINKEKHIYIGVYYYKKNKKWAAFIYLDKKEQRCYLGLYDRPEKAALAYNQKAIELNKKRINIINPILNEQYILACQMA